jgi:hypothetical protein
MTREIIWEDLLDRLYACEIERDGDKGRLTITLLGEVDHVLHREMVPCDRADVTRWRTRCERVIDSPDLRVFP